MKFKLPKIRIFSILFSLKYLYVLILLLLIGLSGILGLFLYKNLYQTIAQTEEIMILRQEVAPDIIDMKRVEAILESLNKKTTTTEEINWQEIKNPFYFTPSEPAIPQPEPGVS